MVIYRISDMKDIKQTGKWVTSQRAEISSHSEQVSAVLLSQTIDYIHLFYFYLIFIFVMGKTCINALCFILFVLFKFLQLPSSTVQNLILFE